MRSHRIVLASVVALTAAGLTTVAEAAPKRPKPVCLQVTDDEGDAKVVGAIDSASLDIISADIATGTKNLVVAIRTKSAQRESTLLAGRSFSFDWTVGGTAQRVLLTEYDNNERVGWFYPDAATTGTTGAISVPVTFDPNTATVTWTVARKHVAALKGRGAKFSDLKAISGDGRNIKAAGTTGRGQADSATSSKTYIDYTPTCLKGA